MKKKNNYYLYLKFTKHNIFFSILSAKGKLLYARSLGRYGLTNFKYFNVRYINLLLDSKVIRRLIKFKDTVILKIFGKCKGYILVRVLNILKKLKIKILGLLFQTLISFNGCKLKV